jgi:proline racemase
MCVTTVLLEMGIVPMTEPETVVVLDTPAGLVTAVATCRDGRVERSTIEMPVSFVEHLDLPITLDDGTRLEIDVAYGGAYYALVDADAFDFRILPAEAPRMVALASRIKQAVASQVQVRHPEYAALDRIEYVMYYTRLDRTRRTMRGCTVIHPGRIDRSPCGTGTSARLAVLHARGEIDVGETVTQYSTIDSRFEATVDRTVRIADRAGIVPRIAGRAWIYDMHQMGVDPSDPYPLGYTVPDTWGQDMA